MSDWWSSYGPFKKWKECPTRPDPVEVLLFYLGKRGVEPDEQAFYLMDLLDLQRSSISGLLQGRTGWDSISRCRQLVTALKIHPPLLGIDAKYYPIERHPCWWETYGFPFNADPQGHPIMGEVIAYLRLQRTQGEGGRAKAWSKEDLGSATGLNGETIRRMEREKNHLVSQSMSRRNMMALALRTLDGENEPTIFRLFGLDPQAYGVPVPAHDIITEVHFSPRKLTDETLKGYHRHQATLWVSYYTCHGEDAAREALEWLRRFPALMSSANTTAQRVSLLALECRYHGLIAGVAREQRKTNSITFHADKAIELAEQAMTLPMLGDHAQLLITNELLATALLWRADASYEFEQYEQAQADIDRALNLLPALQSTHLKIHIVADAALIHAYTATSPTDQTLVCSYFNLATQMDASNRSSFLVIRDDDNFIRCDTGMLYLRKAMALCAPNMKGATSEKVTDILENAQKYIDPEMMRRHTLIAVFQAQAHAALGDYQQATEVAILALEKSRQIRSRLNRDRIEGLYQQLLNTSYRDKPRLAYLGMKLRTWNHGMAS